MGVADFPAAGTESLPRGAFLALDQTGIRGEVLNALESVDVVYLVEKRHGEDLAGAGDGAKSVEVVLVMDFDLTNEIPLELFDETIVMAGEL